MEQLQQVQQLQQRRGLKRISFAGSKEDVYGTFEPLFLFYFVGHLEIPIWWV